MKFQNLRLSQKHALIGKMSVKCLSNNLFPQPRDRYVAKYVTYALGGVWGNLTTVLQHLIQHVSSLDVTGYGNSNT